MTRPAFRALNECKRLAAVIREAPEVDSRARTAIYRRYIGQRAFRADFTEHTFAPTPSSDVLSDRVNSYSTIERKYVRDTLQDTLARCMCEGDSSQGCLRIDRDRTRVECFFFLRCSAVCLRILIVSRNPHVLAVRCASSPSLGLPTTQRCNDAIR